MPFWQAVLGYDELGDEDLTDPRGLGPNVWFQAVTEERSAPARIHIDVSVPPEQARQRVEAAVAAGGRVVYDEEAPMWWTLADPDGNLVEIATWEGRD